MLKRVVSLQNKSRFADKMKLRLKKIEIIPIFEVIFDRTIEKHSIQMKKK